MQGRQSHDAGSALLRECTYANRDANCRGVANASASVNDRLSSNIFPQQCDVVPLNCKTNEFDMLYCPCCNIVHLIGDDVGCVKLELFDGCKDDRHSSLEESARRRRKRVPWRPSEVDALRKGIAKYGEGRWEAIRQEFKFDSRSGVDLKDKWRNLTRGQGAKRRGLEARTAQCKAHLVQTVHMPLTPLTTQIWECS